MTRLVNTRSSSSLSSLSLLFSSEFLTFSVLLISLVSLTFPLLTQSAYTVECEQQELDGFLFNVSGNGTLGNNLFALYRSPVGSQQALIAYSPVNNFFVNQVVLSGNPVTNGQIEFQITPLKDGNSPGVSPVMSVALNGLYYYDPVTGNNLISESSARIDLVFNNFRCPGSNLLFINVTTNVQTTGYNTCAFFYAINITCAPPTIRGDPQFVGLRGQSFQVHGIDGAVYNLISDPAVQLNSRFSFLTGPRPCPIMPSTGRKSVACWSHPGSYLGEMGLKTSGGNKLKIISGPAATGYALVTLDDIPLKVGSTASLTFADGSHGHVIFNSTHELTVLAGAFEIEMENNDEFINLRSVRASTELVSKLGTHGLLGQTWRNKRYSGKVKEIEGEVDDYLVDELEEVVDQNLFSDAFMFNRFVNPTQ